MAAGPFGPVDKERRVKRRSFGLLAFGSCLPVVAGCKVDKAGGQASGKSEPGSSAAASSPASGKPGTIALTLMTYNNPFFSVIKAVARKTAEAKGFQFREHDAQLDANKQ